MPGHCTCLPRMRPPGVRQYASATRHTRAALRRVSLGLRRPCPPVRYKALICCAASSRLVVLVRVDSMFDPWMLIGRLCRGACLSPVLLTSYLRLKLPTSRATMHKGIYLENIFKFTCLASALGMQSLKAGIALFCAAQWFSPCNWEFISQIYIFWF